MILAQDAQGRTSQALYFELRADKTLRSVLYPPVPKGHILHQEVELAYCLKKSEYLKLQIAPAVRLCTGLSRAPCSALWTSSTMS